MKSLWLAAMAVIACTPAVAKEEPDILVCDGQMGGAPYYVLRTDKGAYHGFQSSGGAMGATLARSDFTWRAKTLNGKCRIEMVPVGKQSPMVFEYDPKGPPDSIRQYVDYNGRRIQKGGRDCHVFPAWIEKFKECKFPDAQAELSEATSGICFECELPKIGMESQTTVARGLRDLALAGVADQSVGEWWVPMDLPGSGERTPVVIRKSKTDPKQLEIEACVDFVRSERTDGTKSVMCGSRLMFLSRDGRVTVNERTGKLEGRLNGAYFGSWSADELSIELKDNDSAVFRINGKDYPATRIKGDAIVY